MRCSRTLIVAAMLGGMLTQPALVDAQGRGRAVPRHGSPHAGPPPRAVAPPYRPYYYRPHRPPLALGFYYYGSLWPFGPYAYGYRYPYGYDYRPWGYAPYGPYLAYPGYPMAAYGGVRIDVAQSDAEVYVDGYFTGLVDDFDGAFQQVNLEPGPHSIELRAEGFEPVEFDVNVQPGRTITYRAALRKARP